MLYEVNKIKKKGFVMFFIFIRACRKYKFTFVLNTNNGLILTLHPNNVFETIEIKQGRYNRNYFKLFLEAIKKMKNYRRGCNY